MPQSYSEGQYTKRIEAQTARLPSTAFLGGAIGSMAISALLKLAGKDEAALFVGQWAAPFLLFGVYNKLVKQLGSERRDRIEGAA